MRFATLVAIASLGPTAASGQSLGYFRYPTVFDSSVVFTAEGDLWRVPITGGTAQRLTTAPGEEAHAAFSPDGRTIAFSASYAGPTEVYVMPAAGGAPVRLTYEGGAATVAGWTPDGKVLYSTRRYAELPEMQLATVDPKSGAIALVPLAQASDGAYDAANRTLFFTRFPFQGSSTKRYRGGTAQSLWRFASGGAEAAPLTADYTGTSRSPMVWQGRVYFLSDRDGTMNLWSMDESGHDLRQLTHHTGFDVQSPSLGAGRIVYQLGADLRVYDIASTRDAAIPIRLVSDFDQTLEHWIRNPVQWISAVHLSPTGDRVVVTARGQVYVAPVRSGRFVDVTHDPRVRWRIGRFMPDGRRIVGISDASGEQELWTVPANGVGSATQLTKGGTVLRWDGIPSPDGRRVAHTDKDQQLWVLDLQSGRDRLVATSRRGGFGDLRWSRDGRWLAYVTPAPNDFDQVHLYSVETGLNAAVTSDRYDSHDPVWSFDGRWLYFLSERNLQSTVSSPWGSRQPEPYFDKQTKIYALALAPDARSPFQPDDELSPRRDSASRDSARAPNDSTRGAPRGTAVVPVRVELSGIAERIVEVPLPAGDYSSLGTDGKRLYFLAHATLYGGDQHPLLRSVAIGNRGDTAETYLPDVQSYELSLDGRKLLVHKGKDWYVAEAGAKAPAELARSQVEFRDWQIRLDPREEWRQMFADAWRLERDYFWDRGMSGVDWNGMRARYAPLVERVTDRSELNDILAQMVGELSTLHIFVHGGDLRQPDDTVLPASLGAMLERDAAHGGYRVAHIYRTDPDDPTELAPLARYGVHVEDGDIIEAVNGEPTLSVPDIGALLQNTAEKQVLLHVRPANGGVARDVIVTPISPARDADLRYAEWEYSRREHVDSVARDAIGYVHLRAMGGADIAQWARDFYPVFDRQGLIIDVRHNRGGNIDSWILEKLLRKAWFYFQPRVGDPTWNMQYAFRGHVVVLTDEFTASDGEAFSEGFRRLQLGKLIGTRTWGGEIWLSASNFLVDRGIATAAEIGVYSPDRAWLIEGHGVDPDIVVDNLPHATFEGHDAQLDAAIAYLQREIREHPVPVPAHPAYPDKALRAVQAGGARPGPRQ